MLYMKEQRPDSVQIFSTIKNLKKIIIAITPLVSATEESAIFPAIERHEIMQLLIPGACFLVQILISQLILALHLLPRGAGCPTSRQMAPKEGQQKRSCIHIFAQTAYEPLSSFF